jgi:hypothetical protein
VRSNFEIQLSPQRSLKLWAAPYGLSGQEWSDTSIQNKGLMYAGLRETVTNPKSLREAKERRRFVAAMMHTTSCALVLGVTLALNSVAQGVLHGGTS